MQWGNIFVYCDGCNLGEVCVCVCVFPSSFRIITSEIHRLLLMVRVCALEKVFKYFRLIIFIALKVMLKF